MLRRRKHKEVNLLELIPERIVESAKRDDGLIDLIVPKFRHRYLKEFFMKRMKKPTWKVELDEIGTFVWDQMDGKTTVEDIGKKMQKKFGDKVEPIYDRLNQFFYLMKQHDFISFQNYPGKE
jgi:hypothetical protein